MIMVHTHAKHEVKGQFLQKLTDGRTDKTDRKTFPAEAVSCMRVVKKSLVIRRCGSVVAKN